MARHEGCGFNFIVTNRFWQTSPSGYNSEIKLAHMDLVTWVAAANDTYCLRTPLMSDTYQGYRPSKRPPAAATRPHNCPPIGPQWISPSPHPRGQKWLLDGTAAGGRHRPTLANGVVWNCLQTTSVSYGYHQVLRMALWLPASLRSFSIRRRTTGTPSMSAVCFGVTHRWDSMASGWRADTGGQGCGRPGFG